MAEYFFPFGSSNLLCESGLPRERNLCFFKKLPQILPQLHPSEVNGVYWGHCSKAVSSALMLLRCFSIPLQLSHSVVEEAPHAFFAPVCDWEMYSIFS